MSLCREKTILLIDDDDVIRELLQMAFELADDWRMLSVNSGRKGVLKAKAERPDVILLDVEMPDLDGIETLKLLQADPLTDHIPVIFITARPELVEVFQRRQSQVKRVIPKPFEIKTLEKQVASILES